jgi:hypothetical protein
MLKIKTNHSLKLLSGLFVSILLLNALFLAPIAEMATRAGSVGVEAVVPSNAPTTPATITTPSNGQTFTENTITVSGLCQGSLIVKIFKNGVFAGAVECRSGSYSLVVDLLDGRNELIARVYDNLDQPGPDSNMVAVNFNASSENLGNRVTLSSLFAKRGANPGEQLNWPLILEGGQGPYALSIDWGDGSEPQLLSRPSAGTFDVSHQYSRPGVYNLVIKATDVNNSVAFLQLVAVANGKLVDNQAGTLSEVDRQDFGFNITMLWIPILALLLISVIAFWLGKRHAISKLRHKIDSTSSNY